MLTLVSGGSASGKSEFAESLVVASLCNQRFYLATMIAYDEECRQRIARHRTMRRDKGFQTIEVPTGLHHLSFPGEEGKLHPHRIALLECMSNLTANEFFSPELEQIPLAERGDVVAARILKGVEHLTQSCAEVVIVTNELFSDGMPYDEYTRAYLQTLGQINQKIAKQADRVVEVVAGISVFWKGEK